MNPRDLASAIERRYDEFVDALAEMVDIDCGTFVPAGVNRIADLCEKRFRAGGWEVERISHEPPEGAPQLGDILIGQLPAEGPRILLIGHTDTVFPDKTAAGRPFRVEGTRAFGPGVSDMKSGLLAGLFAVEALQEAGAPLGAVTYVCNPDEEIGSPFSGPVIRDLAGAADVAFVLESGRENGDIVSARKGVSDFVVEITGRAAHAGVEPERGRSAVLAAALKTVALHELNRRWPGVTVNVGVIEGGIRPNVVAEFCRMHIDLRSPQIDTMEEAEAELERICAESSVPDIEVSVKGRRWHRPMEKTPGIARLAELAKEIAAELGFEVNDAATGGASDANSTAAAGVPTLDGLGLIGGADHAPGEWADLGSFAPRVSLLAGLIAKVSEDGAP